MGHRIQQPSGHFRIVDALEVTEEGGPGAVEALVFGGNDTGDTPDGPPMTFGDPE
jgi:hypothetical protein